jgi:hypothetical protein
MIMALARNALRSLGSGLIGSIALTAIHETARRRLGGAPRMDVIGKRGLRQVMRLAGRRPSSGQRLYWETLASDLAANAIWYSLVGRGRRTAWLRGSVLGAAAGLGAVLLPERLGLGKQPGGRSPETPLMTFGWYLAGGLAAAAAAQLLEGRRSRRARSQVRGRLQRFHDADVPPARGGRGVRRGRDAERAAAGPDIRTEAALAGV